MTRRRVPRATYRLQLVPERGLHEAAALVPYLAELGVSHVYLSPSLEAAPGSQHGYDVTDPTRLRDELGGEEGMAGLRDAAHDAGLGLVLDIVPNHVGLVSPANPWWWDVLARGPEARHARHLDVQWRPGPHGQPTLLLPELGSPLEQELAGEDLRLEHHDDDQHGGGWRIVYHEHVWPVREGSLPDAGLDPEDVPGTLAAVAGHRGRLAEVLDRQHYRLAHWPRANEELDHRRFFAVSGLGGVRIEDHEVFDDAHARVLPLVADGTLDGLRLDHPDGLRDPVGYLRRLRDEVGDDVWVVVEKILEHGEPYRTSWPIDGTVGYEFADLHLGLHVDAAAGPILDDLQARLTGRRIDRDEMADEAKRMVLDRLFGAEVDLVTDLLVAASDLHAAAARRLLLEVLAAWPVYRTYLRPHADEAEHHDLEVVDEVVARVRARTGAVEGLDQLAAILRLQAGHDPARSHPADGDDPIADVVWRFQQLTGPVVAKGVEDTLLYRDLRLTAVNEVGGAPGRLGRDIGEAHAAHRRAQEQRPATMLLTSTHDTKRSGDVRARLATLSQDPDHWVQTVDRLREVAAPHRGARGPSPAHEHLAWQSAVGAWPISPERLEAYLRKAAREGAEESDHLEPDDAYEADLAAYVRGLLGDPAAVAVLEEAVDVLREPGWLTSLSMTLLKLTAPGVPDIYQGDELWDLSLVDPDNRRPVDHDRRARMLADLRGEVDPATVMARLDEGLPKLWLLRQALDVRARRPQAFGSEATYEPLWADGDLAEHVLAFGRTDEVVAVAPLRVRRLGARFADWDWGDTRLRLPEGRWHDVLGAATFEGEVALGELLRSFPVALLEHVGTDAAR
jgi:(1->4)-alpha-D-glucan 1-alpha-D-glucosylmutase